MSESVLATTAAILTATREALGRLAPFLEGAGSAALAEAARVEAVADSLAAGPVRAEGLEGVPELPDAIEAGRQAQFALLNYAASLTDLGMGVQATALALGNVADGLACAPAQPEPEEQPDPVAEQIAQLSDPTTWEKVMDRTVELQPDGSVVVLEDRMAPPPDESSDAVGELPEEEDGTAYEAPLGAPAVHANPPADPAPQVPLTPKKKPRKRR